MSHLYGKFSIGDNLHSCQLPLENVSIVLAIQRVSVASAKSGSVWFPLMHERPSWPAERQVQTQATKNFYLVYLEDEDREYVLGINEVTSLSKLFLFNFLLDSLPQQQLLQIKPSFTRANDFRA